MQLQAGLSLTRPRGYKTWVHSQSQIKAQWLAACGHVRKQPIIVLYFEFEIILQFYNLEAWSCTTWVQIRIVCAPKIAFISLLINSNMCFVCSKEPSHWDGSFEYPQHMFWLSNKKDNFPVHTLIWRLAQTPKVSFLFRRPIYGTMQAFTYLLWKFVDQQCRLYQTILSSLHHGPTLLS